LVSWLCINNPWGLKDQAKPLRQEFPAYTWKIGRVRLGMAPAHATCSR
jgi:hypothetical protein